MKQVEPIWWQINCVRIRVRCFRSSRNRRSVSLLSCFWPKTPCSFHQRSGIWFYGTLSDSDPLSNLLDLTFNFHISQLQLTWRLFNQRQSAENEKLLPFIFSVDLLIEKRDERFEKRSLALELNNPGILPTRNQIKNATGPGCPSL